MSAASSCLPSGSHAFLTIGRRNLECFTNRRDLSGVIRMIEPPALPLPANWSLQLARPPFSLEEEMSFFARIKATHLVTKNAGGEEGRAKLDAARRFRIPVIMIARPTKTAGLCVADLSAFNDLPSLIKSAGK
jgi:precorrin-6A/cobalt-precorrin-6A reductase